MAKFEPRAHVGILVGCYLQPGGRWKGEFQVFLRDKFLDFDWERPRNLKELIPIRAHEVKMTDATPQYMLKASYDDVRRCLLSPMHINVDADITTGASAGSDGGSSERVFDGCADHDDDVVEDGDLSDHTLFVEWKIDSKGRRYAYDVFGSRILAKGITATGRPNTCAPMIWRRMSASEKRSTTAAYHAEQALKLAQREAKEVRAAMSGVPLHSVVSGSKTSRSTKPAIDASVKGGGTAPTAIFRQKRRKFTLGQLQLLLACMGAATCASHAQEEFMGGMFEGMVLDYIHSHSEITHTCASLDEAVRNESEIIAQQVYTRVEGDVAADSPVTRHSGVAANSPPPPVQAPGENGAAGCFNSGSVPAAPAAKPDIRIVS